MTFLFLSFIDSQFNINCLETHITELAGPHFWVMKVWWNAVHVSHHYHIIFPFFQRMNLLLKHRFLDNVPSPFGPVIIFMWSWNLSQEVKKKFHCVPTRTLPFLILLLLLHFRSYYIRAKAIHFMLKGFLQSFSLKSLPKQVHLNKAKL